MDASSFDRLARTLSLAASRRAALGALLASAGGTLGIAPLVAAQGCLATGATCSDGSDCCSGRCKLGRKSGIMTCRQVKNQGICTIETNLCVTGDATIHCGTSRSGSFCHCVVTTKGYSFCADDATPTPCTTDRECERKLSRKYKCVQEGPACTGGSVCWRKCENPTQSP